jgi:hypothetical protein
MKNGFQFVYISPKMLLLVTSVSLFPFWVDSASTMESYRMPEGEMLPPNTESMR